MSCNAPSAPPAAVATAARFDSACVPWGRVRWRPAPVVAPLRRSPALRQRGPQGTHLNRRVEEVLAGQRAAHHASLHGGDGGVADAVGVLQHVQQRGADLWVRGEGHLDIPKHVASGAASGAGVRE